MNQLVEKANERETSNLTNLVNLAHRKEQQSHVSELVNNLPNYKESIVWQDLIKIKARKQDSSDVSESGKVSGMRRNFSIRSPLNFTKLPDKKQSMTRNNLNESQSLM